jgi:hypothetical protein
MTGRQQGQEDKRPHKQQEQEGNLGQKDARLQKEKDAELSHMGEKTEASDRKSDRAPKNKR